ncbi:hypothetical protein F511_21171 [Dorcoceras hygrometricum]|uniref:Uncharacterized protein n=1 Tax=Dorcoceras hygrometricum TaxID=472368 RepID=A0A2Z7A714_9LAMI|nr:hypothetical protein F511_21171 [Dorcoceras hygrometricum]
MMTSALLLKESRISNDDVSISIEGICDVSNISRQLSGISDDDISSDVITISRWIRRSAKEKLLTDVKNKGKVELFSAVSYSDPVASYSEIRREQPLRIENKPDAAQRQS